jgi:two-component system LytT family response regulator
MNAIRAAIVEDEPLARRRLRDLLSERTDVVCVGEADSGTTAIALMQEIRPELVFLDIELPEFDGFEVLRRSEVTPTVIFTTAYDRYAVSAFELAAVDYLLKPFGAARLDIALERARRVIDDAEDSPMVDRAQQAIEERDHPLTRFFVRDRGKLVPVLAREIERLEADDDYVRVYTRGRVHLVYLTLNDFERRLDPDRFIRVHRTHMVNLDFVRHLLPHDGSRIAVEMTDGTKVLASRARSKSLRELTL